MKEYSKEIKKTTKKLNLLIKKQKELVKLVKQTNKSDFNRVDYFEPDDIVVFKGDSLIIARIIERDDCAGIAYKVAKDMNFSHKVIRKATKDEIELLGDRKILILED